MDHLKIWVRLAGTILSLREAPEPQPVSCAPATAQATIMLTIETVWMVRWPSIWWIFGVFRNVFPPGLPSIPRFSRVKVTHSQVIQIRNKPALVDSITTPMFGFFSARLMPAR